MGKERPFLATLNGGEVSPLSLGRIDLARMRFTAETMINMIPKVIGPMQMRPGLGYLGTTLSGNQVKQIPFIFAADDTAMIELSNLAMQIVIDDVALTRVSVATAVTNGDFSSGVGWTLTVTGSHTATIAGGKLVLNAAARGGTNLAKRSVTVAGADQSKEHALRIVIDNGPVQFRCGSTDGGDEYLQEATLNTGTYSLAFTPTGNFFVQFSSKEERDVTIDAITIEAAGPVSLPTPWTTANLTKCRYDQSGDVIFVANSSRSYQTRRIERRASARSWGIALHENKDGGFRGKTADVGLTPTLGDTNIGTLAASSKFFRTSHVGTIFRLFFPNTKTSNLLSGADKYTDTVRVVGVGAQRSVNVIITGVWVGTLTRQFSYDDGVTWVTDATQTANSAGASNMGADNATILVRYGFVPGEYTSGTATVKIQYEGGGGWGVVRVTSFTSDVLVNIEMLSRVHRRNNVVSNDWEEGVFSDLNGWPSSCAFFDGRFWLGDNVSLYGSVSDNFDSLDLDTEGDSGPIIRSIATGPVNRALWLLGLGRLIAGTSGSEAVPRSTSFDEVMTPTNFSIKDASTYGSADVAALKIDKSGIFIERSGKRAYVISYSVDHQDYGSKEVTKFHPTVLGTAVSGVAVQRQPDTRIWFCLADGTAACLIYEPDEDVIAWWHLQTDGVIEDIAVLPNSEASDVYFIVKRNINGVDTRYREKLAYDTNAQGGVDNYIADSYVTANLVASSVMTGLSHLNTESVVVWVNGSPLLDANGDPSVFVVGGGQIALGASYTGKAIAGLSYTGQWKSTKLAYGAQMGTAVSQRKQIKDFAPVLYKTHLRALRYGRDFNNLNAFGSEIEGATVPFDTFLDDYDAGSLPFDGTWDTDSRVCIQVPAPLPCTILGFAGAVETHETG